MVLPGCDAKAGCKRAEHIRQEIEVSPAQAGEAKIPLTVSMGVANSAEWTGLEAESFIRKADEALYRAKPDGRNRVVIARPEGFDQVHPAGQLIIA